MDSPQAGEAVAWDANCCIKRALTPRGVENGYFELVKAESWKNIVKAVNQRAQQSGVTDRYKIKAYKDRAVGQLSDLFGSLTRFPYDVPDNAFTQAKQFFISNEVDVYSRTGVRKASNIPEDNDIKIFVATDRLPYDARYLLTDDSGLYAYAPEIENSEYGVTIIEARKLTVLLREWEWPH